MPSLVAAVGPGSVPPAFPTDWLTSSSLWSNLFSLDATPLVEKVIRTVLVYLVIVVIIRVAGKRTLAQWNSFDLVVMLLLSNVVQNAIIGPDTSLLGGAIGAVVLVGFNAIVDRWGFLNARTTWLLEGEPTTLIEDGRFDEAKIRSIGLRDHELLQALHEQGADSPAQVEVAKLQPGGTFNVRLKPEAMGASVGDLEAAVATLKAHLDTQLAAMETRLAARP